jgi:hypothetical protein
VAAIEKNSGSEIPDFFPGKMSGSDLKVTFQGAD